MEILKKVWPAAMIFILLGLGILTFVLPDKEMSQNENRYLAGKPTVTFENIINAKTQQEMDDYLSDQFPQREGIMTSLTAIKKGIGFKDIGGAYIGKDGFYFTKVLDKDIDYDNFKKNLKKVSSFADKNRNVNVSLMLVPSKETMLKDKLPRHARVYDAKELEKTAKEGKGYKYIDLYDQLQENMIDDLYFKTDHHWTAKGAYYGYRALMGTEVKGIDEYDFSIFSKDFLGTLFSKTLDKDAMADEISIIKRPNCKVVADGKTITMYDQTAVDKKDKYQVFFGGNYGRVSIKCEKPSLETKGKKILLVKDSFANAMAPYLLDSYEEIYMIDLRYYSGLVGELIKENGIADVVFLYEMTGFASTKDLAKLALEF